MESNADFHNEKFTWGNSNEKSVNWARSNQYTIRSGWRRLLAGLSTQTSFEDFINYTDCQIRSWALPNLDYCPRADSWNCPQWLSLLNDAQRPGLAVASTEMFGISVLVSWRLSWGHRNGYNYGHTDARTHARPHARTHAQTRTLMPPKLNGLEITIWTILLASCRCLP